MIEAWIATRLCDSYGAVGGITVDNNGTIYFTTIDEMFINIEPQILFNVEGAALAGIVWNGNNILYICDRMRHRILSYSIDTGNLFTVAGNGDDEHKDGNIAHAQFSYPKGIAMDRNGDLYITEQNYVRKINLRLGTVITIAGSRYDGHQDHKDGEAKQTIFHSAAGIAVSDDGTIYVADAGNHCIRAIKDGIVSTVAGTPGVDGNEVGPPNQAQFSEPTAVVVSANGVLLVGDLNAVRRVDLNLQTVLTLREFRCVCCSLAVMNETIYVGTMDGVWKVAQFTECDIKSSLNNTTTWKHIRLFLVGDSGAGKTSVVRWLKGEKFDPNHTSTDRVHVTTANSQSWKSAEFDIKDYMADIISHPTNNITTLQPGEMPSSSNNTVQQISNENHTEPSNNTTQQIIDSENISIPKTLLNDLAKRIAKSQQISQAFHVWDIAGQEDYYTHHFFLSSSAIYLLVVDVSEPIDTQRIKFWMDSVRFYAASTAPIIVIGTHADFVRRQEQHKMQAITDQLKTYEGIHSYHTISCILDQPNAMQELLVKVSQNPSLQTQCPLRWMLMYNALTSSDIPNNNNNNGVGNQFYVSLKEVNSIAASFGMNAGDTKAALQFYHELGFIFYFDQKGLDDIVFTKPQELVSVLKTVVASPMLFTSFHDHELQSLRQTGRLSPVKLTALWKNYPTSLHSYFWQLLKEFGLAFPDPVQISSGTLEPECDLIVPCLIETSATEFVATFRDAPINIVCHIETVPPLGFPNRLLASIMNLSSIQGTAISAYIPFKGGCIFRFQDISFCLQTSVGKVVIQTKGFESASAVVGALQQILQQVYHVACSHNKTHFISTTAKCFNCKTRDAVTDLQQGRINSDIHFAYEHFCCYQCRVLSPTGQNSAINLRTEIRLEAVLASVSKWNKLCDILDAYNNWRKLAEELSLSPEKLDRIQRTYDRDPEFSPSGCILKRWQHEEEATLDNFIHILSRIDNEEAKKLVISFQNAQ